MDIGHHCEGCHKDLNYDEAIDRKGTILCAECDGWKDMTNYAIRNIEVSDEEEVRIPEDKWGFMRGFWEEGVPLRDLLKLNRLIKAGCFDLDYDAILEILLPHMSHKEMHDNDYDQWEFRCWNDVTDWPDYEEWKKDIE
jgi:hypothetical protein